MKKVLAKENSTLESFNSYNKWVYHHELKNHAYLAYLDSKPRVRDK